jgi:hypothetical protein
MTFKLRIPGRDEFEPAVAANSANPLIQTEPISRLAGLADITASIEARQLAAELIAAAMRRCDQFGDDEAKRAQMRSDCLETPPHLQADLLQHFKESP